MGAFILIDSATNDTVAAGMIDESSRSPGTNDTVGVGMIAA
jgi:sulfate adenylyltransferase subunit 1 (EFTu-like GTPase family)